MSRSAGGGDGTDGSCHLRHLRAGRRAGSWAIGCSARGTAPAILPGARPGANLAVRAAIGRAARHPGDRLGRRQRPNGNRRDAGDGGAVRGDGGPVRAGEPRAGPGGRGPAPARSRQARQLAAARPGADGRLDRPAGLHAHAGDAGRERLRTGYARLGHGRRRFGDVRVSGAAGPGPPPRDHIHVTSIGFGRAAFALRRTLDIPDRRSPDMDRLHPPVGAGLKADAVGGAASPQGEIFGRAAVIGMRLGAQSGAVGAADLGGGGAHAEAERGHRLARLGRRDPAQPAALEQEEEAAIARHCGHLDAGVLILERIALEPDRQDLGDLGRGHADPRRAVAVGRQPPAGRRRPVPRARRAPGSATSS